jgi:hypothetical protein
MISNLIIRKFYFRSRVQSQLKVEFENINKTEMNNLLLLVICMLKNKKLNKHYYFHPPVSEILNLTAYAT